MNKNKSDIRVRFAPSPTGFLHIGGLRTAFYNYLFAKKNNGTLILRIEDTDQERFVPGAVENLLAILKKVGLEYQEGPTLSGPEKGEFGPYTQSQRLKIYQDYANQLVTSKQPYRCYCSPDRLARIRQRQQNQKLSPKYDGHCRTISDFEITEYQGSHIPAVIRFWMPEKVRSEERRVG